MDNSRLASRSATTGMLSSRRLSSNSSLSSLSELGQYQHPRSQAGPSSSSSSASSRTSSSSSPNSTSNMMKKLGSRFALNKKKDPQGLSSATDGDTIEELAATGSNNCDYDEDFDDDDVPLATAKPRHGRTLVSSQSTAGPSSVYGDLNQSGGSSTSASKQPSLLRHRSSLSNLNTSINSNTSNNTSMRQSGTLRHRASISSLSGSEVLATSPPSTAKRQPNTLRHRSSVSSLSSVTSSSSYTSQILPPPTTATRMRTMSSAAATGTSRPSAFPAAKPIISSRDQANHHHLSGSTSTTTTTATGSLSTSRRLSATHTGLSSIARSRTTSLISPPKAFGTVALPQRTINNHLPSNATSSASGDTSVIRRGIPKSSTSSIARLPTSSSSSSTASGTTRQQHKRLGSLAMNNSNTSFGVDTTPKPASSSSLSTAALRRIQRENIESLQDSPGLEELLTNTTIQMRDLDDMLSPLAVSKTQASGNKVDSYSVRNTGRSASSTSSSSAGTRPRSGDTSVQHNNKTTIVPARNGNSTSTTRRSPTHKEEEEQQQAEVENIPPISSTTSPSKSSLPVRTNSISATTAKRSSQSPSPTKMRPRSVSPTKKTSNRDTSFIGRMPPPSTRAGLTKDGLPALPGSSSSIDTKPTPLLAVPSSSSSTIATRTSSSHPTSRTPSPLTAPTTSMPSSNSRLVPASSKNNTRSKIKISDNDIDRLLAMEEEPSFTSSNSGMSSSPGGFLTADSSTILMQADLSRVVMTPLRAAVHHPTTSKESRVMKPVLSLTGSRESANDDEKTRREGRNEEEQEKQEEEKRIAARQRRAEIEELLQKEREKIRSEIQAESAAKLKQIQDRASTEQASLSSKLAAQQQTITQQSIQINNLNKILSKEANDNLKLAQLELEISKQSISSNQLRNLKTELNELKSESGKREKVMMVDKTRMAWKGYEKELEVERTQIGLELDVLEHVRCLIGHIALKVQDEQLCGREEEEGDDVCTAARGPMVVA